VTSLGGRTTENSCTNPRHIQHLFLFSQGCSPAMGPAQTLNVSRRDKAAQAWSWHLTFIYDRRISTPLPALTTFSHGVNSSNHTVLCNTRCNFSAVTDFSGAGVEEFVHRRKISSFFILRTTFLQLAVQDQHRPFYTTKLLTFYKAVFFRLPRPRLLPEATKT